MKNPFQNFTKRFSEGKFWRKLSGFGRQAGLKVVYSALLLYYAYHRKETPAWARRVILGVLGYLITPIDALPDLSPIVGYTDDFGVLTFGLVTVAAHINKNVREQARTKLTQWFGDYDEKELEQVDEKL